jgi:hypothetical protein
MFFANLSLYDAKRKSLFRYSSDVGTRLGIIKHASLLAYNYPIESSYCSMARPESSCVLVEMQTCSAGTWFRWLSLACL